MEWASVAWEATHENMVCQITYSNYSNTYELEIRNSKSGNEVWYRDTLPWLEEAKEKAAEVVGAK